MTKSQRSSPTNLHADALAVFDAAVRAVEPRCLVSGFLERTGTLPGDTPVTVVAAGKAAAAMVRGAAGVLGERLAGGVAIAPADVEPPADVDAYRGGHPLPNDDGVRGAEHVLRLAESLGQGDVLLVLLSGGGSALMTLPAGDLTLDDLTLTTRLLLEAGATIGELNTVRKHLERLKGGRLAAAAAPARVVTLALSDVVGDPLDVIASGPTVADPTTFAAATAVLERRGVAARVPPAVRRHLERGVRGELDDTPKPGDPRLENALAHVVGSNRLAVDAAMAEAERHGYRTLVLSTTITGEARDVGGVLGSIAREVRTGGRPIAPPACLLMAGESTVTVRGQGRGGRNQEVALGAAFALDGLDGVLVASLGTDGVDGPTDAAGAFADGTTLRRAAALGLDPADALARNDAYPFFDALGDLVKTGPTGTNVMDLVLALLP